MARLLTAGAETNSLTLEGPFTTGTFTTTTPRSGNRCFDCSAASSAARSFWTFTGAVGTTYLARAYVFLSANPAASRPMLRIDDTGGFSSVELAIQSDGTVQLNQTLPSAVTIGTSAAIPLNAWVCLELSSRVNAGANDDAIEGRVNFASFAVTSTANLGTTAPNRLGFGNLSASTMPTTCLVDDVALNDSTGAAQTSWSGDGKEVLLLPTSDNSAGSWRAGSAASAVANGALFDAVNNLPPTGTTSPDAATAAISNTISGATTPNYDANMTTYTAAGLAAGDTVNLVQQIVAHGEDIATGTKTGTFAMVSNPAIAASASFNFGADVGAVGTWATNWTVALGAISYAPAVTVGTAPVARITKTDTGTRAADCCFMGVYVDYTPAPPVIPEVVMAPPRPA